MSVNFKLALALALALHYLCNSALAEFIEKFSLLIKSTNFQEPKSRMISTNFSSRSNSITDSRVVRLLMSAEFFAK